MSWNGNQEVNVRYRLVRIVVAACLTYSAAACSSRSVPPVPQGVSNAPLMRAPAPGPAIPKVGGVYNGTVIETSQGRSLKAKLKITIKQSGDKFTGIFDVILKTVQDEFPITKGRVVSSDGRTILHFTIEGSPGRNAKAAARLVGKTIKGKAKVPPHGGPAVRFKYSATA